MTALLSARGVSAGYGERRVVEHDHRIVTSDRGLHEPKGLMGCRREHDPHTTCVQEEGGRNL